jgi:elongation factor Tu
VRNHDLSPVHIIFLVAIFIIGLASCDDSSSTGSSFTAQQNESSAPTAEPVGATDEPRIEEEGEQETEPAETEEPDLESLANAPFLMPISGIESIRGLGTVIVGTVERGTLEPNTEIEIVGVTESARRVLVTSMEAFHKLLDIVMPGDDVGLLLRGVGQEELQIGQVAAAPDSIASHQQFAADVRILTAAEGGVNQVYADGYRPQLRIWTLVVTGELGFPDDVSQLLPGDEANLTIELIFPAALEIGTTFDLLENDRVVGTGIVTAIER